MPTEIILQHGWGFAASMWQDWLPELQSRGAKTLVGERGYFGEESCAPVFSENAGLKIVIAHSLGLHLLDAAVLRAADAIMIIGGFLHFHSGRLSQKVIAAMLEKMQHAPNMVLKDFSRNCFQPEAAGMQLATPKQYDVQALLADLNRLNTNFVNPDLISGKTALIVHGTEDIIVPLAMSDTLQSALPGSRRFLVAESGHALPMTRRQECLRLLVSETPLSLESKVAYVGSSNR